MRGILLVIVLTLVIIARPAFAANTTTTTVYNVTVPSYTVSPGSPGWEPGRLNFTLPDWLKEHSSTIAIIIIGGVLLLATETTAPVFAVIAAALTGVFAVNGWISIPEAALGFIMIGAGLGLIVMKKRG